jgi:hypothetical protein
MIECESLCSVIKGITASDSIFSTTEFRSLLHIVGGKWRNCKHVWHHGGNHSLSNSLFDNMVVSDCEDGFHISASVGNIWRNIRIDTVAHGWYLGEGA